MFLFTEEKYIYSLVLMILNGTEIPQAISQRRDEFGVEKKKISTEAVQCSITWRHWVGFLFCVSLFSVNGISPRIYFDPRWQKQRFLIILWGVTVLSTMCFSLYFSVYFVKDGAIVPLFSNCNTVGLTNRYLIKKGF